MTYPWPGVSRTPQRNANRGVSWNTSNQEGYSEEEDEEPARIPRRTTSRRIP